MSNQNSKIEHFKLLQIILASQSSQGKLQCKLK